MRAPALSHVVGVDDAPFDRRTRGDVLVVGTVFAGLRLEGILSGWVRRDGRNATGTLAAMIGGSRFSAHLQAVLLQGIALGGFNVVDIHELSATLGLPVVVVSRKRPDMEAIRSALLSRVPGGERKWQLIERAGPMERAGDLWIQRAGLDLPSASTLVGRLAVNGRVPEPIRVAHLVAGGIATGESLGRP